MSLATHAAASEGLEMRSRKNVREQCQTGEATLETLILNDILKEGDTYYRLRGKRKQRIKDQQEADRIYGSLWVSYYIDGPPSDNKQRRVAK
jgi:hypothetical protein